MMFENEVRCASIFAIAQFTKRRLDHSGSYAGSAFQLSSFLRTNAGASLAKKEKTAAIGALEAVDCPIFSLPFLSNSFSEPFGLPRLLNDRSA